MASGAVISQHDRANVEARLKSVTNDVLKTILRAYQKPIYGVKSQLQTRCLEVLNNIEARGDLAAFNKLYHRVNNRGDSPPPAGVMSGPSHGTISSTSGYRGINMAPAASRPGPTAHRLPQGGNYFTKSPFYEIEQMVMPLGDLPGKHLSIHVQHLIRKLIRSDVEMPQNRHTIRPTLTLDEGIRERLVNDPSLRLLLYSGPSGAMNPYSLVDIAFPNQLEVKVNGEDVKHNFKGLKNKPGSTKPADITSFVRKKQPSFSNQFSITYALTTKRFSYCVYLARYMSPEVLTGRIKKQSVIPKQQVIHEMNKANDDPDIAATSTVMSLKDPISTLRITLPIRSTVCSHNQCFDGTFFMQLQEQAPTWSCPVCSKHVSFPSLCVDQYVEDILSNTKQSIEKVTVEPNGQWSVLKDGDEEEVKNKDKPRAAYDNESEDDLVEVVEPAAKKPTNGLGPPFQPTKTASPFPSTSGPINTPPVSSREPSIAQSTSSLQRPGNKRASSAVIDLTLSDDDEPPRPAKRQTTSVNTNGQNNQSNPYSTPTSIPDHRQNLPGFPAQHSNADYYGEYRPGTGSGRHASVSSRDDNHNNNAAFGHAGATSLGTQSPARPPSGSTYGPPSFASVQPPRPPSASIGNGTAFPFRSQSHEYGQSGLRLPPMQSQPPDAYTNGFQGWRSDRSNYSNSPGS
ncbi:hypothetical protein MBLNU230_g2107t1 [Neophaeotheca triangularis]